MAEGVAGEYEAGAGARRTHEDAASCVVLGVAGMDADALESGHAHKGGEPSAELGTVGHHEGIAPFGYGRASGFLACSAAEVAARGFEGVAEEACSLCAVVFPRWGIA